MRKLCADLQRINEKVNEMFGINVTDYDKLIYEEYLRDFLPDKMIDIHVHLWTDGMEREGSESRKGMVDWTKLVAPDCTIEDLLHSYTQMFPGKSMKPVLMGWPSCDLQKTNSYALKCAKEHDLPVFYCTNWDTPAEEIRKAITEDGFCGIKPYLNNSPSYIPASEVRIFDFLPHEHLKVCDELGAKVMLHIPRSQRLRDPVNLAQMLEIEEKYTNAKVIIAHIGRAYCPEDFGDAFERLAKTKNLFFDFTANTLDRAMVEIIKAVGPDRVMFGSDMPITKMRMYRIVEDGRYINVVPRGMYGDVSYDKNMRETDETKLTTFMYEELLAFRRCAEELHLTKDEVQNIMGANGAKLFGMKL